MGPNVLTTHSFQVLLTEMGLPIHPALLCVCTPKAVPSVVVTVLLFPAWPRGEAVHPLGPAAPVPASRRADLLHGQTSWQQKQHQNSHQISLQDGHRALLQSPKDTCCLFRKACIFSCHIYEVRDSLGCTCLCCNYN